MGESISVGPIAMPRKGVSIHEGMANPGLGGTEFVTVQEALRLSEVFSDVRLIYMGDGARFGNNLRSERIESLADFHAGDSALVLMPAWYAMQLNSEQIGQSKLVVTSHHPHDGYLPKIINRLPVSLVLSVGAYTYMSNNWLKVPHAYHRNPVTPYKAFSSDRRFDRDDGRITVGHVSSLHPSKGFLDVAKAWPTVRRRFPGAKLEVLGGISMYGEQEAHEVLPTTRKYGSKILQVLGDTETIESVRFYGVVEHGVDKIMANWDLAILNPTGLTEADPASVKDCFRVGVPLLGGYDYGMTDYLRKFPEMQLRSRHEVAKRACRLLARPDDLEKMRLQMAEEWSEIVQTDRRIRRRLIGLLEAVVAGDDESRVDWTKSEPIPCMSTPVIFRNWLRSAKMKKHS